MNTPDYIPAAELRKILRRFWYYVAAAYAVFAIGVIVSLYLFGKQSDDIDNVNKRLVEAAIAYCQAGIQPDAEEKIVLEQLATGTFHGELDPVCVRIGEMLREAEDGN